MSPKCRVIAAGNTKEQRKKAREKVGKLRRQIVNKRTEERYYESYEKFLRFHHLEFGFPMPDFQVFDDMVAEYIEELWEAGDPKSYANYTLASIQFYRPEAKHHLPWAWKLVKVWNQLEVPQRATPLTPELLMAFAGQAFRWKQFEFGWLLVIGFTLFLRTGELLSLRAQDVLLAAGGGVVFLPSTKGAKRSLIPFERIEISKKSTTQAFRALLKGKKPGDFLWTSSRQSFMSLWHSVVEALHLQDGNFFPYSLRRGGATSAYRAGSSLDQLVTKGRWQQVSTARLYLDLGLQAQVALTLPKVAHPFLTRATSSFLSVSQSGTRGRW